MSFEPCPDSEHEFIETEDSDELDTAVVCRLCGLSSWLYDVREREAIQQESEER